ncbi:mycothiol conjugate amidase Mca [Lentzea sp. NPDC051213]|uniref:mycothiol conjugate amidase Mca n=1 Tax=Lentzea sp. NPDC051213 TaxID=3364126 RepID=UPI0037AA626D
MRTNDDDNRFRLMAVHAHPDDESSKGAAAMAKYAADGAQVLVVTCTGGEQGDVLNPEMAPGQHDMGSLRRAELARACELLGVRHQLLGFADSGLAEQADGCFARQPLDVVTAPLVRVMREFRPHVVLAYDRTGGYPHPDHVMCHRAAVEAFDAAGDPDLFPEHGPAWLASKLYFHVGLHPARLAALLDAAVERPPSWAGEVETLLAHDPWPTLPVTTRVPCGEHFATKERALRAHQSQIDPRGFWFVFPADVQRAAWPTEDFHLARTRVHTELPENDLFAGIAETAPLRLVG